nr:aldehyde dehydrogenase family protein [Fodinicola feengrottensis]
MLSDAALFIDGTFQPSRTGRVDAVMEKATDQPIGSYAQADAQDVDRAVAAARTAQPGWAALSAPQRSAYLTARSPAIWMRARRSSSSSACGRPGGVRLKAEDEVTTSIRQLRISAVQAVENAGDVLPPYKAGKLSLSRAVPLGVIGLITPWNYPMNLAMRAVAPALAFGNTVVLKPAELTPIIGGQVLAEAAAHVGLPRGVLNVVTGDGPEAGWALAEHRGLDLLDFTGSRAVGLAITASAAADLRPVRVELGGDNAFLVLEDADIDLTASCAMVASLEFQGQACISSSRHIVHRAVVDRYVEAVTRRVEALRVGDPLSGQVELGPLISAKQRDRVHKDIVERSVAKGARVVAGGTYVRSAVLPADCPYGRHAGYAGVHRGDLRAGHPDHRGRLRGGGDRADQRLSDADELGVHRRPGPRPRRRRAAAGRRGARQRRVRAARRPQPDVRIHPTPVDRVAADPAGPAELDP